VDLNNSMGESIYEIWILISGELLSKSSNPINLRGFKVIIVVSILNILFLLFTKATLNFFLFDQLRYIFTFFYLTFIPGFLLCKLLKLEKMGF
jgi:hypothetical protein